jgi:hypothetical protein
VRRLLLAALALSVLAACSDDGPTLRPTTTAVEPTTTTPEADGDDDDDDDDDDPRATPTTSRVPDDVLTPAFPPVVAGLGDSLLYAAHDDIDAGIQEDVRFVSEALIGVTIQGSSFGLERIKARRPAATAVVLGTNNASDGSDEEDVAAVGELMADLSRLPCVRWVEVSTSGPDESFNRIARAINAELHRVAAQYATVDVVPWADAVADHPEWMALDRIHHTPAGEAALAEVILDALAACPQTLIRR